MIKEMNDLEGTGQGTGSYGSTDMNAAQIGVNQDLEQSRQSSISVTVSETKLSDSDQRMKREHKNDTVNERPHCPSLGRLFLPDKFKN